ncbi:hypothetical protein BBO01nite_24410 [Brevibacillus borstelensis]|nr:hypothetical protein BBO01nite_24410 [Brevibacillus borstelensis]
MSKLIGTETTAKVETQSEEKRLKKVHADEISPRGHCVRRVAYCKEVVKSTAVP